MFGKLVLDRPRIYQAEDDGLKSVISIE